MHEPQRTVIEKFSEMPADQFRREVTLLWQAASKVIETIAEQVEEGSVTPVQGLGIIGCTASQLYAYSAFHGEASTVDLLSALNTREFAASR